MRRILVVLAMGLGGLALLAPLSAGAKAPPAPPALAWAPTTSTSPATFDYGTQAVGSQTSQTFTLTNSGGVATAALKVALTGASFTKTADGCSATSLGPKKSCTVTVRYSPSGADSDDSGSLAASSKKPAATATLALKGQGAGTPDIRVSCQDAHDTCTSGGYWDVNCCQDATITFTNVGTGPTETLALVDVDQHPEFTISNDTCTGTVLAPGESCSFLWTYSAHCFNDSYVPVNLVKASDTAYVYSYTFAVPLPCSD